MLAQRTRIHRETAKTYAVLPFETNGSNYSICNLLDTNFFILPDCREDFILRVTATPIKLGAYQKG
jgi:hypothetical protein